MLWLLPLKPEPLTSQRQFRIKPVFSFRFLRCSPFDEYKLWKAQVDNGSNRGRERLNILMRTLLLRRTKDQLDSTGKPLVETLPLIQIHTSACPLPWFLPVKVSQQAFCTSLLTRSVKCFRFLFLIGPARCIDFISLRMSRLCMMWCLLSPGKNKTVHLNSLLHLHLHVSSCVFNKLIKPFL